MVLLTSIVISVNVVAVVEMTRPEFEAAQISYLQGYTSLIPNVNALPCLLAGSHSSMRKGRALITNGT